MPTLSDKLLTVAICWVALAAFAASLLVLPKRLSRSNPAVSPVVWFVLGAVGVVCTVGVIGTEPKSFYLVALSFVVAAYLAIAVAHRREAGKRPN